MKHILLTLLLTASIALGAEWDFIIKQQRANGTYADRIVSPPASGILIFAGNIPQASTLLPVITQQGITQTGTLGAGATGPGFVIDFAASTLSGTATLKSVLLLDNVTNDVQTKASVMPNTVPTAGQIPIGDGTKYVPLSVSGHATLSSTGALTLATTGVTAGTYTNATVTVDIYGRVTGVSSGGGGGGGSVTDVSIVTANGISGTVATSTTTPAITLTLGAITPSSVNASGVVTGSNLSGTNTGDQTTIVGITGTLAEFNAALTGADFATGGGTVTGASSGTNTGDQTITLTGPVTGSGTGTFTTTITANSVDNTKLADMVQATIRGRAVGAGTGDPTDLTATQVTAIINEMIGDSGSGVTKGLVPAATTGNATVHFLRKDGSWATPAGSGGNVTTATTLTSGRVIYGNGGSDITKMTTNGNTTDVLHGGSTPSWGQVNLTADVIGTLPTTRGGTGNSAGYAISLGNAGSPIDVVSAAAPTAGQTLTATDSTHATWQTPAPRSLSVFWDATAASNLTGTYIRVSPSTTLTVTATAHGQLAGHKVNLTFTGGAVSGAYTVISVIDADNFNITTVASTSVSGNVTLNRRSVFGSRGIQSVVPDSTSAGVTYLNFSALMANDDYSAAGSCSNFGATLAKLFTNLSGPQTTGYAVITTYTEGNVLTNFNRNMVIIVPAD